MPTHENKVSSVPPVGAKPLVVIIHLQSDGSAQSPVDVQQPLQDELAIFLRTETHGAVCNDQSSWSEGISCWPPATAAQYQVYVQTEALAFPQRGPFHHGDPFIPDPPFILTLQAIKRIETGCFRSRTLAGGVFKVSFYMKLNVVRLQISLDYN